GRGRHACIRPDFALTICVSNVSRMAVFDYSKLYVDGRAVSTRAPKLTIPNVFRKKKIGPRGTSSG
ncbi:MAG: hypothetical protein ACRD1U_09825, partial [Vicinamibacterales bacterium]